jgi:uncharacterized protein
MASAEHGHVPWREVALFVLIAYALTWAWNGIWILPQLGTLLAAPTTPADSTRIYGNAINSLPGMLGPLIAAVVMRLWVSREGLRGSLGLRQSWRAYAVALIAPIAFMAIVALVLLATGLAGIKALDEPITIVIVPLFALLLFLESVLGFGEEYGWRGYMLPRLMPLGEVRATLLLGIIWQVWHFPVLLSGLLLGGNALWLVVLVHIALVVVSAFPYTWLARATAFSPAVAAVFHGAQNWSQQRLLTFLVLGNVLLGVAVIGASWLVVVLVYYGIRWLSRRRLAPVGA